MDNEQPLASASAYVLHLYSLHWSYLPGDRLREIKRENPPKCGKVCCH